MQVKVDISELKLLQRQLQHTHKAALPNAVRNTLNSLANDVKTKTLKDSYKNAFTVRKPTFQKANSGYTKAKGFDISAMKSEAGMTPNVAENSKAIARFKEQEDGGNLKQSFVTQTIARKSGTERGVLPQNYWKSKIDKLKRIKKGNSREFVTAVIKTGIERKGRGKGGFVIYGEYLYEVIGYKRLRYKDQTKKNKAKMSKKGSIKIHFLPIYRITEDKQVSVKPTKFVQKASKVSLTRTNEYFEKAAKFQIEKYSKK